MFSTSRVVKGIHESLCQRFISSSISDRFCCFVNGGWDGVGCACNLCEAMFLNIACGDRIQRCRRTARMTSLSSIDFRASPTASPTLTPVFLSSSAAARKRGFSLILEVSWFEEDEESVQSRVWRNTYPGTLVRGTRPFHSLRVLDFVDVTLQLFYIVLKRPVLLQLLFQNVNKSLKRWLCGLILSLRRRVEAGKLKRRTGYPKWRRKFEVCSEWTRMDCIAEGKGLEISRQHTGVLQIFWLGRLWFSDHVF